MTKKDQLNKRIKDLKTTLGNIKIEYKTKYRITLDVPDISKLKPQSKKFKTIYNDIMSIDLGKIKAEKLSGFIRELDFDSDYLKITRLVNTKYKNKSLRAEFTAKEYKELLDLQRATNKVREEYGLKIYKDLNFKRGTDFETAKDIILKAGDTNRLINNLNSFIDGVITNLDKAIEEADVLYNNVDVVIANQLKDAIEKSRNIDLRGTYEKLNTAIDKIGTSKFNEFFSSDQEAIRDTGIMQSLIDAFGLNIDIEQMLNVNINNIYLGDV